MSDSSMVLIFVGVPLILLIYTALIMLIMSKGDYEQSNI